MIPIYEQGCENGIGHGLSSFIRRFDQICTEHLSKGRAKSFAFIFYDFTDQAIRKILTNQGVFAQLGRLSGKELSVFYLHAGTEATVKAFNAHFLARSVSKVRPRFPALCSSASARTPSKTLRPLNSKALI